MTEAELERIRTWLIDAGIAGLGETDLLHGFCRRCNEAGLPLSRAVALLDTLHPIYEGRAFRWHANSAEDSTPIDYGRTNQGGEAESNWQRSAFFELLATGAAEFRSRIGMGGRTDLSQLEQLKEEGHSDYLAMVHRFAEQGVIGEMDCAYSHWVTAHPEGFADEALDALRRLVPPLVLAMKAAALARMAGTLVEVYLGADAGQRVLGGRILRGVADRIGAVLWFSDLRGYTTITDTAPPEEIIPLLNDYAEAVISAIHAAGGDVLKLIGDGTLAIFKADDPAQACRAVLAAEADLRRRIGELNVRRAAQGRPVTTVYLGLHIGEVFYGNIGSEERLDFTVVGPAVNEVARIASMCRSVDRHVLISSDFADATPDELRGRLVSVGRFALRGVGRAQDLFTVDPTLL
ncbi:MAG TPA: adenylate/guanylate cyclase domain-containing protein [Geminicoccus sp.]|jgi:adenylate cyclase|uniref:adenylate/guanylate cyclase domain-containing protein n=1 Tax=Geminicoccus sp. TaxID=2024832 RepID=UPI002E32B32C|nr:adenylate/guanylate cyclase domain-containing protein [Geminicoccus sp.]HEX2526952.1 adenylate/guanylate cyclase domain-containing protein [Geminicoccus sp.]